MKRLLTLLLTITALLAQAPDGYYDPAADLTGEALQQALHDIIDGHTSVSYTALWTHFQTTDVRPDDGKVWDMYSDIPGGTPAYEYTFVTDQCGNYSGEGSCYNREHSWPKSWFNSASPMYTDLFHIVPTDGYVNGRRSNFPYGEVSNPTWTSTNGSKLGPNTTPGYSGTVFEPIDAYKGDFARIYFYMSTRYFGEDASWNSNDMVDGAQLKPWALEMLLAWAAADTVSQKKIDRNNAIYGIQGNRNPFVDHPEFSNLIWGGSEPVALDEGVHQPEDVVLRAAYPNPFNAGTVITFSLPVAADLRLDIFDLKGQQVAHLLEGSMTAGLHELQWLGTGNSGHELPSGIYLLRLTTPEYRSIQRVTIIR